MANQTRYILPVADIIAGYRENIVPLVDLHVDWDIMGHYIVDCIQSPDAIMAERIQDHEPMRDHQDDMERRAINNMLDGLKVRLYQIGFWTTTSLYPVRYVGWMGDDIVVDILFP